MLDDDEDDDVLTLTLAEDSSSTCWFPLIFGAARKSCIWLALHDSLSNVVASTTSSSPSSSEEEEGEDEMSMSDSSASKIDRKTPVRGSFSRP